MSETRRGITIESRAESIRRVQTSVSFSFALLQPDTLCQIQNCSDYRICSVATSRSCHHRRDCCPASGRSTNHSCIQSFSSINELSSRCCENSSGGSDVTIECWSTKVSWYGESITIQERSIVREIERKRDRSFERERDCSSPSFLEAI